MSIISLFQYRLWYVGLTCMLRGIRKQISLVDRSMLWLKELYIQLYYENGGCEPLASDALRVSLHTFDIKDKIFNQIKLRRSVEQITRSFLRQHRHPTLCIVSERISLNSKAHNLKPNNRHPRQA